MNEFKNEASDMKYLAFSLFALLLSLTACGGDDEPSLEYTNIKINQTYVPASITVGDTDTSLNHKCSELNNKNFIVNAADELPDDPIGFTPGYSSIDYNKYTLLVTYRFHPSSFDTYESVYTRNNYDKTYDWFINLSTSESESSSVGLKSLTRFAIEVPKLPKNATLRTIWKLSWAGQ